MEKKKQFVTATVFSILTIVSTIPSVIAYFVISSTNYEGWDGLGAAILFALILLITAGLIFIFSTVSTVLHSISIRSSRSGIRTASILLLIWDVLTLIASATVLVIGISGNF